MSQIAEIVALRLKALRKERGWTQEQLVEKSQISIDHLRKIETAKTWVSRDSIGALASAFGIDEAELFAEPNTPRAPRALSEEELALEVIKRFDLDPKRAAICKLALTAQEALLNTMHDSLLRSYLEGVVHPTTDHQKPTAG